MTNVERNALECRIDELCTELDRTKTENAKQRKQYEAVIVDYRSEVAKLRELADRMLSSIKRFEMCSDSYKISSIYEQWMRELGINA